MAHPHLQPMDFIATATAKASSIEQACSLHTHTHTHTRAQHFGHKHKYHCGVFGIRGDEKINHQLSGAANRVWEQHIKDSGQINVRARRELLVIDQI